MCTADGIWKCIQVGLDIFWRRSPNKWKRSTLISPKTLGGGREKTERVWSCLNVDDLKKLCFSMLRKKPKKIEWVGWPFGRNEIFRLGFFVKLSFSLFSSTEQLATRNFVPILCQMEQGYLHWNRQPIWGPDRRLGIQKMESVAVR